jgi:hypothetical protein
MDAQGVTRSIAARARRVDNELNDLKLRQNGCLHAELALYIPKTRA